MRLLIWTMLICTLASCGCASGPDPFAGTNRHIDNFNRFIDRAVVKDFAMGYEKHVPEPVRDSFDNFFNNLGYVNDILNDHLQGRFAQGWRNTERLAINSTIGVLGLMDVAEEMGRPRQSNDFGITLGKWGFSAGPYIVLPVLGPSSLRDAPAIVVGRVTNPMFWLNPPLAVSLPMDVISFTDQRARIQPEIDFVERAALDQYTFTRDLYLRYRAARIGGEVPEEDLYGTGEETMQKEAPPDKAPGATDYLR